MLLCTYFIRLLFYLYDLSVLTYNVQTLLQSWKAAPAEVKDGFFCVVGETIDHIDGGGQLAVDVVGQVVAQMGRLVVGCILPADAHAIGVVVHQCRNGIGRWGPRRENHNLRGVFLVPHH